MRRRALLLLFLLPLLLLVMLPVCAEESGQAATQAEKETKEGLLAILPDAAKPVLPDPTDSEAVKEAVGFRALFSMLVSAVSESGTTLGGTLLAFFGITVLFATVTLFVKERAPATALYLEGAAALGFFTLLAPTAERVFSFFTDLRTFSLGLSPIFVSLLAAGGGTGSAGAASAGFSSFVSILSLFSETVFPSLLRILLSLALLSTLGNGTLIGELSKRISGIAIFLFSTISMLFLASLAFESTLAASADTVAIRTLKYTINSSIPVVGSTVSGALGALQASLSLLKSAAGGTAVIALLSLLLPPLIEVLLVRVALSLSESVAVFMGAPVLQKNIARFRGVMDLALAALAMVSLLFLITVGVFARLSPFGA